MGQDNNSDKKAIKSIIKGNDNAFKYIMQKYEQTIFKISFAILNGYGLGHLAEDCLQEVLLKTFLAIKDGKIRNSSKLGAWIGKTTKNKAIDMARHEKLQPEPMGELRISSSCIKIHSSNSNYDYLLDVINNSSLSKRYKEVLLKFAETGSVTETASFFDLSPGRISIMKDKAIELIRELPH